jgi:hypothetical protein
VSALAKCSDIGIPRTAHDQSGAATLIIVADRKIFKHVVDTGNALIDIPVRATFEYELDGGVFVAGSMQKKVVYNLGPLLRRFPSVNADNEDAAIHRTVDASLIEHLRYTRQAEGEVVLYAPADASDQPGEREEPAQIILPD